MRDMIQALPYAHGYSDSKGIPAASRAIFTRYELWRGFPRLTSTTSSWATASPSSSTMTLQALVDNGDQVLIPAPDYPLWTAYASLASGTRCSICATNAGLAIPNRELKWKITERTKAIVVINPNNPTGAVYSREILTRIADLARKHQLCCSPTRSTTRSSTTTPSTSPGLRRAGPAALTFNGLSKAYRVAGYRSGWLVITGPKEHAGSFIEGISLLANMRLCPNVPAQHAIQVALGGHQSIDDLVLPGGRLEQRDVAWDAQRHPRRVCVKPRARCMRFHGWTPRSTTSPTTSNSSSTCCCRRRSS